MLGGGAVGGGLGDGETRGNGATPSTRTRSSCSWLAPVPDPVAQEDAPAAPEKRARLRQGLPPSPA